MTEPIYDLGYEPIYDVEPELVEDVLDDQDETEILPEVE